MIYYFTPFDLDKNLGRAYNQYCTLVPNDEDWICFTDGDSMFLTSNYGQQIQDIINKYPEVHLFTCLTNRVGNVRQRYNGEMSNVSDIMYHRQVALDLQKNCYDQIQYINKFISGHFMLFKKKTWSEIGGFPDGLLRVDNKFSTRVLRKPGIIAVMKGVYLFHYYRLHAGSDAKQEKSHLR